MIKYKKKNVNMICWLSDEWSLSLKRKKKNQEKGNLCATFGMQQ